MRKKALVLALIMLAAFLTACSIYYHQGKHGRGGVVITVPEKPEVRPMPDENKKPKQ